MTPIPFPLFEPDRSPFLFQAGDNLLNCIPVADGWGPVPTPVVVSTALPSECLGAIAIKDADNTLSVFAGTQTNLYKLNTSTSPYSWTEVSKSTGAYSVPTGDRWSFTPFGRNLVAHQLGDVPQVINIDSGVNFADLGGSPPTAKHSAVVGDHLVFGWIDGEPDRIQMSAVNDITGWDLAVRGADLQDLPDGNGVAAILPRQGGAHIVQRDKIRLLSLTSNSDYSFTITMGNAARGTIAPYSVVQIAGEDYVYLSDDGFFRGVQGVPIGGERVDRWFQGQIDSDFLFDVRGFHDPVSKIVWWRYQNSSGEGRLLGYHWEFNRWCYSDQDNTHATPLITPGITIGGLSTLYSTMGEVNVPFDSRLFKGGRPAFAMVTTDHKLAFMTGQNAAATLRTAEVELNPGRRSFVNGARIETDATTFTALVGKADYHGQAIEWDDSVSPSTRTGHLPFRSAGRLHQFEMNLAAGAQWSVISNIRPEGAGEGQA